MVYQKQCVVSKKSRRYSIVLLIGFAILAGASSESSESQEDRLKSKFNLSSQEFEVGVRKFGSADSLGYALDLAEDENISLDDVESGVRKFGSVYSAQNAMELAEKQNLSLDEIENLVAGYGSISDTDEALEKGLSVEEWKSLQAKIDACKDDWAACGDNETLIEHYKGISEAKSACRNATNSSAKYGDPDWGWGFFGTYYTGTKYVETGVVRLIDDRVKIMNGFGAMVNVRVECSYDLTHGSPVITIEPR